MALGYENPHYLKQAQKKQQSLYNGKVLLDNHDHPAVYDSEETLQLAPESRLKKKQLNKETKHATYAKINKLSELFVLKRPSYVHMILKDEISLIVNQVDTGVINFEKQFLKEAAKFVGDFKSLTKEADESLNMKKVLEYKNERLLRAVRLLLLHVDLRGPMRVKSMNGKCYVLVIVDDYSRYNWVYFLILKDKAPENSQIRCLTLTLTLLVSLTKRRQLEHLSRMELLSEKWTLVEAARTIFDKTPYELINRRKLDISFLHVFKALCYPNNDRENIGKLGAKGDIGFFIGYSAIFYAYRVYKRWTKKIMEMMNVTFDELLAMAFKQRSLKLELQGMTYGRISSGLDLTYAPSTIISQKPTERELISCLKQYSASTLTNSSSQAPTTPNISHDVEELQPQPQHDQQQDNQSQLQSNAVAENVRNATFYENTFINPFAPESTSSVESSSQYADPSNMHTFYQSYQHDYPWTKDNPLKQVIEEPSRPVLIRNQLRTNGCIFMHCL
nr:hypothetical protein [Tanacetum cinerariifolium]